MWGPAARGKASTFSKAAHSAKQHILRSNKFCEATHSAKQHILQSNTFENKLKKRNTMKKIIFAIAIVLTLGFTAVAQHGTDGFFGANDNASEGRMSDPNQGLGLPQGNIGSTGNESAPLGTGLLIMTALGAGYALKKRHEE